MWISACVRLDETVPTTSQADVKFEGSVTASFYNVLSSLAPNPQPPPLVLSPLTHTHTSLFLPSSSSFSSPHLVHRDPDQGSGVRERGAGAFGPGLSGCVWESYAAGCWHHGRRGCGHTAPQLPPGHLGAGHCRPPWLPHQLRALAC